MKAENNMKLGEEEGRKLEEKQEGEVVFLSASITHAQSFLKEKKMSVRVRIPLCSALALLVPVDTTTATHRPPLFSFPNELPRKEPPNPSEPKEGIIMAARRAQNVLCLSLVCLALSVCSTVGEEVDGYDVFVDPKKNNKHLPLCAEEDDCDQGRHCVHDPKFIVSNGTGELVCLHKTLFPHFTQSDAITCVAIFFGTILAAMAGIGGGGLNAPIYILITGFIIQEAIPMSHATVMGNSIAQLVINFRQRHPYVPGPGRPLIDYMVPLLLLPPQLGGNNLGVLLNPMIPPDVLIVLAELLLAYATFRVFQKGFKLYRIEGEEHKNDAHDDSEDGDDEDAHGVNKDEKKALLDGEGASDDEVGAEVAELRDIVRKREASVPLNYLALMFAFWVFFAGCYVGLKEASKCSAAYWIILGTMYPVLIGFLWVGAKWAQRDQAQRKAARLPEIAGDIEWTKKNIVTAPAAAGGVGLVAGLLGLGGGELMAPLLLELGMIPKVCVHLLRHTCVPQRCLVPKQPFDSPRLHQHNTTQHNTTQHNTTQHNTTHQQQTASATSAYMIIWTTSSDIIHYSVGGDLPLGYAAFFASLGFIAGLVGRYAAIHFVARYACCLMFSLCVRVSPSLIFTPSSLQVQPSVADCLRPWNRPGHFYGVVRLPCCDKRTNEPLVAVRGSLRVIHILHLPPWRSPLPPFDC